MFYFETFQVMLNPSSVNKNENFDIKFEKPWSI